MLLGDEHAEEALVADEVPDVLGHVVQLMADAPVVELAAELLGRAVEEGALLGGERNGLDPPQPRPVRRAGEELGVPADGAGFERLALGVGDRGHGALERAIGRQHDIVALDAREGQGEEAGGGEPAENRPKIEHGRVEMARAEPDLQGKREKSHGESPGPERRTVHGEREHGRERQKRKNELSHGDSPTGPLPLPAPRLTASKPVFL